MLGILPGAAVLLTAAALGAAAAPAGTVSTPGITLEGVPAGGLDETALRALAERLGAQRLAGQALDITLGDTAYRLTPQAAGLRCDADAAARAVMDCGRRGSLVTRLRDRRAAAAGRRDVTLRWVWDETALDAASQAAAQAAQRAYRPASFTFAQGVVTLDAGQSGQRADASALRTALEARLERADFAPLDFPVETRAAALPTLREIAAAVDCDPVDAAWDPGDPYRQSISEERYGWRLEREAAAQTLERAREGGVYTLSCMRLEPSVTRKLLEERLYRDTLASRSTRLNPSNRERTNNVRLACEKLDGTLVGAGETFSFNDTVGPRTYEAGFRDAIVFKEGEKVDEVGGGVCQVSSTLYMAAARAGLETVERTNHRFAVSYAPLGEDATVWWGSVDYRFGNNTAYPLRIGCRLDGDTVTVTLTGTNEHPERRWELETQILSVTEPGDEEEPDETLEAGQRRQLTAGQRGYTTVTWRVLYENGEERERTEESRSTYQKEDRSWAVGTKTERSLGRVPGWLG